MPLISHPPELDLIRPIYSGDCIAPWILSSSEHQGLLLTSPGGDNELLIPNQIKHTSEGLFPIGHSPKPLHFEFSYYKKSLLDGIWNENQIPNDHGFSKLKPIEPHLQTEYGIYVHDHASFSSFFPPPYRVLLLISLGVLAFGFDLNLLTKLRMNPWSSSSKTSTSTSTTSKSASPTSPSTSTSASSFTKFTDIYFLGALCLLWSLAGWSTFRYYVDSSIKGDPFGRHAQTLQGISVLGLIIAMMWPGDLLCRGARVGFGRGLLRILSPSLSQTPTFSDVILADVLTSYAKVLGDVWLTICFLVPRSEHHTWWSGKGSIAVPILTSLPYAIRLRQCLAEYYTSNPKVPIKGGMGKELRRSRKPLANAAKYASAFPVIWLSAWQGVKEAEETGEEALALQFWLLSVFINSLFSFWWDVTNDWGLDLLRWHTWASTSEIVAQGVKNLHKRGASSISSIRFSQGGSAAGGRRPLTDPARPNTGIGSGLGLETVQEEGDPLNKITESPQDSTSKSSSIQSSSIQSSSPSTSTTSQFSNLHSRSTSSSSFLRSNSSGYSLAFSPSIYQISVVLDLLLRFSWSLKLSSHLHHIIELEKGVFLLEFLEILRRSAWVFFRVEWEFVKSKRKNVGGQNQNQGNEVRLELSDLKK